MPGLRARVRVTAGRTPAGPAQPRVKLSRRGLRWALERIVAQHLTVARIAEGLGVSWNTANDAVLAEGKRLLIDDPKRFDDAGPPSVDETHPPVRRSSFGELRVQDGDGGVDVVVDRDFGLTFVPA